jgi:hypothetical protein
MLERLPGQDVGVISTMSAVAFAHLPFCDVPCLRSGQVTSAGGANVMRHG